MLYCGSNLKNINVIRILKCRLSTSNTCIILPDYRRESQRCQPALLPGEAFYRIGAAEVSMESVLARLTAGVNRLRIQVA